MKKKPSELPALLQIPVGDPANSTLTHYPHPAQSCCLCFSSLGSTQGSAIPFIDLQQRSLEDYLAQQFQNAFLTMRLA
jgi:hypothetical protein